MNVRNRMIEIIENVLEELFCVLESHGFHEEAQKVTDALIAEGIGDVATLSKAVEIAKEQELIWHERTQLLLREQGGTIKAIEIAKEEKVQKIAEFLKSSSQESCSKDSGYRQQAIGILKLLNM